MGVPSFGCTALSCMAAWIDGVDLPIYLVERRPGNRLVFAHANAALLDRLGLTRDDLVGRDIAAVLPPRLAARLARDVRRCLATGASVTYEETLAIGGRDSWWQTTLSRPPQLAGRMVLGVAVETTAARRREFAAAEALAEMAGRFEDLRLYAAMAAHDARGPLSTVAELLDLVLDEGRGDAGNLPLLALCARTVATALDQIGGTLERGRALETSPPQPERVDLGRLAGDIAAMVDPAGRLRIALPEGEVTTDAVVLQMALRNLMANAARHARSEIAVALCPAPRAGLLTLYVADDGPGLPPGVAPAALSHAVRRHDGSRGFGLDALTRLAASRGGSFDTARGPGAPDLPGALFRLCLPGRALLPAVAAPAARRA
ncbi:sensor histidine kinase [Roseicyclus persicicus]|uniref:histidine kinase n=1 Tax=Roseicyclus persicicus TaxID=2650661 RepID=A0A7X6GVG7_9RHOB|nr:PAS domain-containing protein [Roseibacterium persicicum]NKX43127.1 PAS domain-containing protein [Roseibacterium persicicum]